MLRQRLRLLSNAWKSDQALMILLEFSNLLTGIFLLLDGLVALRYDGTISGLNWFIFGLMYLVMGDYSASWVKTRPLGPIRRLIGWFAGLAAPVASFSVALIYLSQ
ncbi:MAG: hypothetical protein ACUVV1_11410 [Fimbriimonadales bacterium]